MSNGNRTIPPPSTSQNDEIISSQTTLVERLTAAVRAINDLLDQSRETASQVHDLQAKIAALETELKNNADSPNLQTELAVAEERLTTERKAETDLQQQLEKLNQELKAQKNYAQTVVNYDTVRKAENERLQAEISTLTAKLTNNQQGDDANQSSDAQNGATAANLQSEVDRLREQLRNNQTAANAPQTPDGEHFLSIVLQIVNKFQAKVGGDGDTSAATRRAIVDALNKLKDEIEVASNGDPVQRGADIYIDSSDAIDVLKHIPNRPNPKKDEEVDEEDATPLFTGIGDSHSPQQEAYVGCSMDGSLGNNTAADYLVRPGMLLWTDPAARRYVRHGAKRSRLFTGIRAIANMRHVDTHKRLVPLGVATDPVVDGSLAKANPNSSGVVSAMVSGAVTIYGYCKDAVVGDVLMVKCEASDAQYEDLVDARGDHIKVPTYNVGREVEYVDRDNWHRVGMVVDNYRNSHRGNCGALRVVLDILPHKAGAVELAPNDEIPAISRAPQQAVYVQVCVQMSKSSIMPGTPMFKADTPMLGRFRGDDCAHVIPYDPETSDRNMFTSDKFMGVTVDTIPAGTSHVRTAVAISGVVPVCAIVERPKTIGGGLVLVVSDQRLRLCYRDTAVNVIGVLVSPNTTSDDLYVRLSFDRHRDSDVTKTGGIFDFLRPLFSSGSKGLLPGKFDAAVLDFMHTKTNNVITADVLEYMANNIVSIRMFGKLAGDSTGPDVGGRNSAAPVAWSNLTPSPMEYLTCSFVTPEQTQQWLQTCNMHDISRGLDILLPYAINIQGRLEAGLRCDVSRFLYSNYIMFMMFAELVGIYTYVDRPAQVKPDLNYFDSEVVLMARLCFFNYSKFNYLLPTFAESLVRLLMGCEPDSDTKDKLQFLITFSRVFEFDTSIIEGAIGKGYDAKVRAIIRILKEYVSEADVGDIIAAHVPDRLDILNLKYPVQPKGYLDHMENRYLTDNDTNDRAYMQAKVFTSRLLNGGWPAFNGTAKEQTKTLGSLLYSLLPSVSRFDLVDKVGFTSFVSNLTGFENRPGILLNTDLDNLTKFLNHDAPVEQHITVGFLGELIRNIRFTYVTSGGGCTSLGNIILNAVILSERNAAMLANSDAKKYLASQRAREIQRYSVAVYTDLVFHYNPEWERDGPAAVSYKAPINELFTNLLDDGPGKRQPKIKKATTLRAKFGKGKLDP